MAGFSHTRTSKTGCTLLLFCFGLVQLLLLCHANISNEVLTSTESSITLTFSSNPFATNYTVSFRLTKGFTFHDVAIEPPYNGSDLSVTYTQVIPGHLYTVEVFENTTSREFKVFEQEIATAPLKQKLLEATARGSNFLSLQWESPQGYTYEGHEIGYKRENTSTWHTKNSTEQLTFNLTGLEAGYSYQVYVVAVTAGVKSQQSNIIIGSTIPLPPVNLTAVAQGSLLLIVSWEPNPSSYHESYTVLFSVKGSGTFLPASCTSSPCTLTPDPPSGQTILIMVTAVSHGLSSEPESIEHSTAPGVVRSLQGEEGVRSLDLQWLKPLDSVQDSYILTVVSIADNTVTDYSVPAGDASDTIPVKYFVGKLVGGFAYNVEVRAVSTYEVGDAKSVILRTLPEPVSNLTGRAVNTTSITLSWTNPENTEYDFINITILLQDDVVLSIKEEDSSSTRTVGGLIAGEEYTIAVTVHAPYNTRLSKEIVAKFRTKPVKPQILAFVSEERSLNVTLARSEQRGVFDSLQASLVGSTEVQIIAGEEQGTVSFTDLNPGGQYTVEAFTVSGSERSDYVIRTIYTRPRPPSSLSVTATSETSVGVDWDVPDTGGYDNFTVVLVETNGITQPETTTTSDLSYEFRQLQPGRTYNVSVVTNKGDQTSSLIWDQNTTSPLAVTQIRVSVRGIDSVTVAWDPPIGSGLSGYAITFEAGNLTLAPVLANVTSYKFEQLEPQANYTLDLFVFSRRSDGILLYSPMTQFNFSTYPDSVAALQKVDATTNSITVNWTAPVRGNFDLYELGIKAEEPITPEAQRTYRLAKTEANATFQRLRPGFVYTIAIRTASNNPRRPQFGVVVKMQALTRPLAVMDVEATPVNTTSVTLRWSTNSTGRQDRFLITYKAEELSEHITVDATSDVMEYEISLSQLFAGYQYSVEVVSIRSIDTDTEDSEAVITDAYTFPRSVSNLTVTTQNSALQISWTAPSNGRWDSYTVQYRPTLREADVNFLPRLVNKADTQTRISDLFPGERYQVQVVAISNDLDSEPMEGFAVLVPLPASDLVQIKDLTTTTTATLQWSYNRDLTYTEKWIIDYSDVTSSSSGSLQVVAEDEVDYSATLRDLIPGQNYTVTVYSHVLSKKSVPLQLELTAKPVISTSLEELSATTNTSFNIGYTVKSSDIFNTFMFTLMGGSDTDGVRTVYREKDARPLVVEFSDLAAGTLYTVEAVTRSGQEVSSPRTLQVITAPNPVPVTLVSAAREITLKLELQEGNLALHTITCVALETQASCGQETVTEGTPEVTFNNLSPYKNYNFQVVTFTEIVGGKAKNVTAQYQQRTSEAAPSTVQALTVRDDGLTTATVSWQQPLVKNGKLREYIISYRGKEPNFPEAPLDQNTRSVSATTNSIRFDALKAGYEYVFQVIAVTVAPSEVAETRVIMRTAAPEFKDNMNAASAKPSQPENGAVVTQTKISYQFVNPFNNNNGYVRYFTVIVSTDPSVDDSSPILPNWQQAKKDSSIKVYQALDRCTDFFTANSDCGNGTPGSSRSKRAANDLLTRNFVVGAESAADCATQDFCNGPLSEDTEYFVKLRAFTASGEFQETEYSEKIKTAAGSSSNTAVIGGVVAAVICLIILVVVIAFIVMQRRRRRPKKAVKHTGPRTNWEQSSLNKFSRPVKLAEFPNHVRKMASDSDFKYAEEYEDLKEVGRDQPCMAAEFPPNRPKNRFTNILPYDHSRVKLLPTDDEEGSDYINANYMPGYNSKREYIATQGPLPATRDDYWRMVWEQSTRNIVMLTRCQEKGREKSDHYWPSDSEPKFYGDLQVVILNETHMPDWTVTEFKIALGENSRNVRHFHYRVWPDFGVPKDPTSLIRFVRTVREKLIREGGPIVTHCSAGVGRSGTFIVLDHVLQLIREKDEVDIFSIVYKLRKERVLMVQTEQQYKFIHECLVCVLEGREEDTTYANVGQVNVGFDGDGETSFVDKVSDDEGINVEVS